MGYSKKVIDKVHDEFEQKRNNAEAALKQRENEMYAACPVLKEIDEALAATGMKVYQAAAKGKDGLEARIEAIKKENLMLQDDKRKILKLSGKPEDYLDIKYACKKCSDTGYEGIKMCSCMKKALAKASYETSGLGAQLYKQDFQGFKTEYYSDKKDASGASPRMLIELVLNFSKDYVKKFGKSDINENILFIGKTGLGKTHLSSAIGKGIIDKGYDVVYETASNIINTYEQQTFGMNKETAAAAAERYSECDLLIIDDLGSEFKNAFSLSVIYSLLNSRINAGKAMLISTNIDDCKKFAEMYDDRVSSRLLGSFKIFKFDGTDIRMLKATKQI